MTTKVSNRGIQCEKNVERYNDNELQLLPRTETLFIQSTSTPGSKIDELWYSDTRKMTRKHHFRIMSE